jgi:hypothetical protein
MHSQSPILRRHVNGFFTVARFQQNLAGGSGLPQTTLKEIPATHSAVRLDCSWDILAALKLKSSGS